MKAVLVALLVCIATIAVTAGDIKKPETLDNEGFRNILADAGKAYIAGQPTREGLERAKAMGATTIINLRTASEMSKYVDFDEAESAKELGLTYIHIPLGGDDNPFTPEALETFAKALKASKGKALLHCASAYRASHMWTAYLVKHEGMDVTEAVAHGRAMQLGTPPMEALLGGLNYSLKPQPENK